MDEQAVFKSVVFGGFDRGSVLEYIKTLTETAEATEKKLLQDVLEATERNDQLVDIGKEYQKKIEELEKHLRQEQEKNAILVEKLNRYHEEMEKSKKMLQEREAELTTVKEQYATLSSRQEMLELKGRKYDESTMQLGCIILNAQNSADEIIAQARERSKEILDEAYQNVSKVDNRLVAVVREYQEFKAQVCGSLNDMCRKLEDVGEEVETQILEMKPIPSDTPQELEEELEVQESEESNELEVEE